MNINESSSRLLVRHIKEMIESPKVKPI